MPTCLRGPVFFMKHSVTCKCIQFNIKNVNHQCPYVSATYFRQSSSTKVHREEVQMFGQAAERNKRLTKPNFSNHQE